MQRFFVNFKLVIVKQRIADLLYTKQHAEQVRYKGKLTGRHLVYAIAYRIECERIIKVIYIYIWVEYKMLLGYICYD